MKDPDSDLDARLQRIQIVKGWIDGDGALHEKVFDVAADPSGGTFPADEDYVDVDETPTCEAKPNTPGQDQLCKLLQEVGEQAMRGSPPPLFNSAPEPESASSRFGPRLDRLA